MKARDRVMLAGLLSLTLCVFGIWVGVRWLGSASGSGIPGHTVVQERSLRQGSDRRVGPASTDGDDAQSVAVRDSRNASIELNGIVLDQNDVPLSEVEVVAIAGQINWRMKGWRGRVEVSQTHTTNIFATDHEGRFNVKGMRGISLRLVFDEQEYIIAPGTVRVWVFDLQQSSRYVPLVDQPEVFRLWRRRGGAACLSLSRGGPVTAAGGALVFDSPFEIGTGWSHRQGSAEVRIRRYPAVLNADQPRLQSWRYEMRWRGARLQLTRDVFPFEAPEDGYEEQVGETFTRGEDGFLDQLQRSLYFRTDSGMYGRAELRIRAGDFGEEIGVYIDACWNPDGSRNLEPMP